MCNIDQLPSTGWDPIDPPLIDRNGSCNDPSDTWNGVVHLFSDWYRLSDAVVVGLGVDCIAVSELRIVWPEPSRPRVYIEELRLIPRKDLRAQEWFDDAVRGASQRRRRRFRRCTTCQELTPPEHRVGTRCHAFLEHQGLVF